MPISLRDSLHLLDTLDDVRARRSADELINHLHQLTPDQEVSETVAQEVVDHVLTHPTEPVLGMWVRPLNAKEWAQAKQQADRDVINTTRAKKYQGWWTILIFPLCLALGIFQHSARGLLAGFVLSPLVSMCVYVWLYDKGSNLNGPQRRIQKVQENQQRALDARADLDPLVLTSQQAQSLVQVPGLAACVTWATDGAVPFLGLDWRQAKTRLDIHVKAERQQRAEAAAALDRKQAPILAQQAAARRRQEAIEKEADAQEAKRILRSAALTGK